MIYPGIDRFKELGGVHNRVVLYREIAGDLITPISLLKNFSDRKYLFLLESANLDKSFSRYTFFGFNPSEVIKFRDSTLTVEVPGKGEEKVDSNPIDFLTERLDNISSSKEEDHGNFSGGYVGFMGYEMANYMGILREKLKEDSKNLCMSFFKTEEFYVFDNFMGKLYAAVSVETEGDLEKAYENATERTFEMAMEIAGTHRELLRSDDNFVQEEDFHKESFMEMVEKLRTDIIDGECIQAVLSNRYELKGKINPINLYRLMRNINPSPYMFYLKIDDEVLCGTSPEIHLKITDRTAVLKPIAGTYRIGHRDIEDIKHDLLSDEKEVAEHLMLLDLARNDLYTGCRTDSLKVIKSFFPEVYSHVVHIVSEVEGELREDVSPLRLFCNTFPAGTLSGAPKVRAMELINEYEKSARGFYGGCAGYFSFSGDVDTCIVIRSAFAQKDSVVIRAGAGIVYDSKAESEYNEVGLKLGALFEALKQIPLLEKRNVFNDR
jgi:anthranilate synthase component I